MAKTYKPTSGMATKPKPPAKMPKTPGKKPKPGYK
jgi:hypothetical protein